MKRILTLAVQMAWALIGMAQKMQNNMKTVYDFSGPYGYCPARQNYKV